MRRHLARGAFLLGLLAVVGFGSYAAADGGSRHVEDTLHPYQEVPSVSSTASGEFEARIDDAGTITWTLSYEDLEGAIQQAHIHFGQAAVNGGISVFLCTNLGNGPTGTQACPAPPATITGTIRAPDVSPDIPATQGARTQGIGPGEFAELVAAIRAGKTYANVHSDRWPGGELRAQLNDESSDD